MVTLCSVGKVTMMTGNGGCGTSLRRNRRSSSRKTRMETERGAQCPMHWQRERQCRWCTLVMDSEETLDSLRWTDVAG